MDNPESTGVDNSETQTPTIGTEAPIGKAPTDTQEVTKDKGGDWLQGLDSETKDHPSLKNFKSPQDLAKSWVNAQKLIGKDKVALPGKNATEAERNEFFNKLGRPEKVEGYKFDPLPEEIQNEPREKNFAEFVHKHGLTNTQANELRKWYAGEMKAEMSRAGEGGEEQRKETETVLRREWGMAFNQNIQSASKVIAKFGDDEAKQALEAVGNNPAVIRMFAKIGKQMSESGIVGKPGGDAMSPDEARAEIAKLKTHPGYINGQHPEHKFLVQRMTDLHKMLYPE